MNEFVYIFIVFAHFVMNVWHTLPHHVQRVCPRDCEDKDPVHMIKGLILECFFGSNVLLNFGALGYSECRVNLIRGDSDVARFIIQVQIRNLRKILTIAANRFPARLHIQLSELVGIAKPIALQVVKYNTNLWSVAV
ncbi:hypothetical protein BBBOND_0205250 [Babesia bigemina]|uniref:Uncharacterized protein n=1 Tax=Babesia bigemina TaxID=5866 RepID=A0A061D5T3_BABBI|nr:hypothetical protein BBBOND_0205250 [Babesia bigemina]CDR95367.1 hypothetical protein BBBOND_0205250 [Babesia bigemina]|eukprot:XP_012767553.1 hypothetical protein BBBOND_0205250 [Babesia bigemina]